MLICVPYLSLLGTLLTLEYLLKRNFSLLVRDVLEYTLPTTSEDDPQQSARPYSECATVTAAITPQSCPVSATMTNDLSIIPPWGLLRGFFSLLLSSLVYNTQFKYVV